MVLLVLTEGGGGFWCLASLFRAAGGEGVGNHGSRWFWLIVGMMLAEGGDGFGGVG